MDLARLEREYYARKPDMGDPNQRVIFGTSGHRGSPLTGAFTEAHVAAITQAICEYRRGQGIDGPLYMGKDTHALSEPAQRTALEVLAANGRGHHHPARSGRDADTGHLARDSRAQPRSHPASRGRHRRHAVAQPARGRRLQVQPAPRRPGRHRRDGVDRGAGQRAPARRQRRGEAACRTRRPSPPPRTHQDDFVLPYVRDLENVVDMAAIRGAGLTLGVDPLGGAARPYWEPINSIYKLDIAVVNPVIDPTFSFMTVDHDGKIRMDPSSPYAMARLVELKDRFRVAFANDCDADRHGIVTRSGGAHESQSLPGRGHPVLADAPAAVAGPRRGRQDAGQQQHDRSRRGKPRPPAVRGAGGLQVVRPRAARRIVLLRRRGERGGELPPSRRHRLDHRQGRSDHGSPRRRDHRAHGQGSGRALS